MKLWLAALYVAFGLMQPCVLAQPAAAETDEIEPPEEDESLRPKEYAFNPLQAEQELKVGNFYGKRGSWRAAAGRFEEATKWNPMLAEAWRRLGEAREKLDDAAGAVEAYRRFLEIAPDDKQAKSVGKRVAALAPSAKRGK